MYQAVEILVPLGVFAMIFGIVYVGVTAQNRKELAMIEAGMNPNNKESSHSKIRAGLLFILVPFGIFIGNIVAPFTSFRNSELGLVFAFLFGGIALFTSYILDQKMNKTEKEQEFLD